MFLHIYEHGAALRANVFHIHMLLVTLVCWSVEFLFLIRQQTFHFGVSYMDTGHTSSLVIAQGQTTRAEQQIFYLSSVCSVCHGFREFVSSMEIISVSAAGVDFIQTKH